MLVLLCLSWGLTWPAMKIALNDIPPFSMRASSISIGAVALCAAARLQDRSLRLPNWTTAAHILVFSLFNIVLFSIFVAFAQLNATTSRVAMLVYTMPIWACLLARPALGERMNTSRGIALVLCCGGMAVLIYPLATSGIPGGILLALGGAVSWAIGTIYMKWARIESDPLVIAAWQLGIGVLVLGACVPAFEGSLHLSDAHAPALLGVVFSGLFGSALAYFLWFHIVRVLPATTATLGALSAPVVGVIASALLLGERPTLTDIVGFALIFSASACVLAWPSPRHTEIPE